MKSSRPAAGRERLNVIWFVIRDVLCFLIDRSTFRYQFVSLLPRWRYEDRLSSSLCPSSSPLLSVEAISSLHLLFLNYHASSLSGPWESDFRRRDGRPFSSGEKGALNGASTATLRTYWCGVIVLLPSAVILSLSIQAEWQGGEE